MEELRQSQEIIDLGKKLVKEFVGNDRRNTTLGWMAHYLSELIVLGESEVDSQKQMKLKKEACKIILEVWKCRNDFPNGVRPLSGLASAVEVINSLRSKDPNVEYWDKMRRYQDISAWGDFAETLRTCSENIFALTVFASIGHEVLLKEKEWAKFPNQLSDDEKQILTYIDQALQRENPPFQIIFTDPNTKITEQKPEKISEVLDKIGELIKLQQSKFELLKAAIASESEICDPEEDYKDNQ